MGDARDVQLSLASNVSAFLQSHAHLLPPENNSGFVWRNIPKAMRGEAGNDDYTFSVMYVRMAVSPLRSPKEHETYAIRRTTSRYPTGASGNPPPTNPSSSTSTSRAVSSTSGGVTPLSIPSAWR